MKPITEELLMAYADGELGDDDERELRVRIDADPQLAKRVQRHRALRSRLQSAYRPVLDEPVPQRLLHAARQAAAAAPVIDLASRRSARAPAVPERPRQPRAGSWTAWGGVAAGLLVGILIARLPGIGDSGDELFASTAGGLVARGLVAEALSNRTAREPAPDSQVALQISFVDESGRYCRTFTTPTLAGLACRDGSNWAVQALQQTGGQPRTEMRQAASALPPELLEQVDRRMRGGALDAAAEQAAVERGWRR